METIGSLLVRQAECRLAKVVGMKALCDCLEDSQCDLRARG